MGVFRQPPQPFLGGRQPLAPETLAPALAAVAEDNPPFSQYARRPGYTAVAVAWIPPPPLPFQGRKTTPPNGDDNPPFGTYARTQGNEYVAKLVAWQPAPPLPTQGRKLTPPSGDDNPPFGTYTRTQGNEYVAKLGQLAPPLPYQGRRTTIVSVDNPPFGLRSPLIVDLSTLQPVQQRRSVPSGVQTDNPPPFARQVLPGAGPPPQPTQGRKLAPALVAVAEDNPPFAGARRQQLMWLHWQTVPQPLQRRTCFVDEAFFSGHSPPAYVPGSSQLGQMYLGAAVLGVANAVPLVATGSSFTISGQFGAIQTSMGCTTGNEDVDIDSTFGPITTSFAITMQGASAQISGQFPPITSAFRIDTAQHTAASITGLFGPITSAFRVTATQAPSTIVPGASVKGLFNFRRDSPKYREEDEEQAPEQVEEPAEALAVPLTPEQQAAIDEQAQIAAAHEHLRQVEQAKAVMRARHAAMLALLSQL